MMLQTLKGYKVVYNIKGYDITAGNSQIFPKRHIAEIYWFLKDDPNSEHEVNLENQVYESFSTDSNWIRKNAENKWLGCHCLLKDDEYNEYTEMICHLSSDILTMLRNNIFDMISTFNSQGNFDHNYILKN